MFEVRWLKGHGGLLSIQNEWHELKEKVENDTFYNSWTWHFSLSAYLKTENIHYFLISCDGAPVAIFPLEHCQFNKCGLTWRVFKFIDHPHMPLSDALIHKEEDADKIFEALYGYLSQECSLSWQLLCFSRLCECSNLARFFDLIGKDKKPLKYSYFVRLGAGSEGIKTLSKKMLKSICSNLKKAEIKLGALTFDSVYDEEELKEAYAQFLELEASGWKGAKGSKTSINQNSNHQRFYQSLMVREANGGRIVINRLMLGEKLIASQFCVLEDNKWNLLKIAYDESYREFTPGNILLYKLLQEVDNQPEASEVSLVTGPTWADRWHFTKEPTYIVEFYNNDIRGALAKILLEFKSKFLHRGNR